MAHLLVVLIAWAAVVAGTLATVAQYRRVRSLGVEGVSSATWLLFTLIGGFWIAYGALSAHSFVVVMGSLLCWPLQIAIVLRLRPWRHRRGSLQAIGMFSATCAVPGLVGGWSYCVYGCGLAMTLLRGPQLVELVRVGDWSGVSAASWFFSASCAGLWIYYYTDIHLWAPLIATAASGLASLTIAALAVWRHRQVDELVAGLEALAA
ncbi:MAG: hypothetical protein KGL23_04225 [Acidobacteriota bacterium]|nr:hypothetical protein [Acidobacteriota bacterium]MDE3138274.1 hypothetical protein [Acidobacteriota bacterium]MDE3146620.1 hypothetical protein [Acidobacteriota bacterium]